MKNYWKKQEKMLSSTSAVKIATILRPDCDWDYKKNMPQRKKIKNFKSVNFDETIFDCYKYQSNEYLLLIFYRGAWCGYCRKQLNELNKSHGDFDKLGVKVLAVSSDSLLNTSLLFNITKSSFPLLADPGYKIFKLFNLPVVKDKKEVNPAIFLINPAKEIVYSYVGKDYKDRPGIRELKKTIKELTI